MLSINGNLNNGYKVALPCEPSQFSKFIGKLLGKPQTITKSIKGSLDITKQGIENTYHLLI